MSRLYVLDGVTPPLVRIVAGIANVAHEMPIVVDGGLFITHAFDGVHKEGSLHKAYAAVDLRTKNVANERDKSALFAFLRDKFPLPRFDVIFEDRGGQNEHIHIEDNSALPHTGT